MAGLRNLCKLYGGIKATGCDGRTVEHVWDYASDKPCQKSEMPDGSPRWMASERAKWEAVRASMAATAAGDMKF